MIETRSRRVLVVADRTESAPRLLEEVGDRARTGCQIALVVPPDPAGLSYSHGFPSEWMRP